MIEQILPRGIAVAESFGEAPDVEPHPAEAALIARAVQSRRRDFVTSRACARDALAQLGIDPVPILKGEQGEPLWPRAVRGSITHTDGYRAAVVGYKLHIRSVGIDAEPNAALPQGVLSSVSLPDERIALTSHADASIAWDRLLFCAKESVYKTWFPLTERWLGFEDAHIVFTQTGDTTGTFSAEILVNGATNDGGEPLRQLTGRWLVTDGLITAAITL